MNRPRLAIQTEPTPVPQLECEYVRCRADFENHAVLARAMDGAGRNEKVIMLPSGKSVDVVFCAERGTAFLRRPQLTHHSLAVYTGLERSEERRVGKECRSLCDWSSDVCSSDLNVNM